LKELADALGWSTVYVSDLERGRRNPPAPEKIHEIAEFLDIRVDELLDLANEDRQRVELNLLQKSPRQAKAALMLARSWDGLSDEEADNIVKVLERKHSKGS